MGCRRRPFFGVILALILFALVSTQHAWNHQAVNERSSSVLLRPSKQTHSNSPNKLAYATLLTSTIPRPGPDDNDRFFVAVRMLVYQILHAPDTRTNRSIPMLVLVDPGVSQSKRARLKQDGAIVIPLEHVRPKSEWLKPAKPRWKDTMLKLRVWELEEYSRVLFIDGDVMLKRPLDGIFDEESTKPRSTLLRVTTPADEAPLPSHYVMAGVLEVPRQHHYPPDPEDFLSKTVFNGGFFVCSPSRVLYRHFLSVLSLQNRFDSTLMDQSLLNYAHRLEGNMPWQSLSSSWNIRNPNDEDIIGGVASVHEKWWKADEFGLSRNLGDWFLSVRWRMHGFHEGRDRRQGSGLERS